MAHCCGVGVGDRRCFQVFRIRGDHVDRLHIGDTFRGRGGARGALVPLRREGQRADDRTADRDEPRRGRAEPLNGAGEMCAGYSFFDK